MQFQRLISTHPYQIQTSNNNTIKNSIMGFGAIKCTIIKVNVAGNYKIDIFNLIYRLN